MKNPIKKIVAPLVGLACISGSPVVFAADNLVLEEVVVTARKRPENLMEAPLAVSAVSGEAADKMGVTTMEQLSAKIPGLQIGRAAQTSNIAIRGIGSGINKGFEQSAGMYVDGVYQPRSRQFTAAFADVQHVEVLRGPQGILFGKNTVAGAIKLETVTPHVGDEFSGSINVALEEYGTQRVTGILSGTLGDAVGARLLLRDSSTDGYIDNKLWDRDGQEKDDQLARLSLSFDPSDNISVVGKFTWLDMKGDGKDAVINAIDSSLPAPSTIALSGVLAPDFAVSTGSSSHDSFVGNPGWAGIDAETVESLSTSIKVEWDLGDFMVTSVTGLTDFEFSQYHDVDFLPVNFIHNVDQEELDMFSQELRIASNWDRNISFITGLYYETQETDMFAQTNFNGTFGVLPASILPGGIVEVGQQTFFEQETDTIAVFGELSFALSDTVTLDLGVRYSRDEKDIAKRVNVGVGNADAINIVVQPEDTVGATDLPSYLGLAAAAGGADGANSAATFAALLNRYAADIKSDRSESHFDPSVKLRWEYSDDGMFFVSYSEGYKSGGFNFSPDTANPDQSPRPGHEFEDEAVEAWEAGIKQRLLDGRARISAIVYRSELEDLQVTSWSGTSFVVGNAAELSIQGLELEGQLLVSENLEIGGSFSYLDHEYDSFPGAGCSTIEIGLGTCPDAAGPGTKDLAGERGQFAPEYSAALFADYTRQFDAFELIVHVDVNYKDEMFLDGDRDPNALQDSYTKVDARIGVADLEGKWDIFLYGRNLTDEATYTASVDAPLSPGVYVGWIEEPRVYGIQGSYRF